jgi:hypothetical protein
MFLLDTHVISELRRADYAGACHRAAHCADPVGFNPPYAKPPDAGARFVCVLQIA